MALAFQSLGRVGLGLSKFENFNYIIKMGDWLSSMFGYDTSKKPSSFNVGQDKPVKKPDYSNMKCYKSEAKPSMCMAGGDEFRKEWDLLTIPLKPEEKIRKIFLEKHRLSPSEISDIRSQINGLTDEKIKKELFLILQSKVEYHSQRDNETSILKKIKNKKTGKTSTVEIYKGDVMCNLTSVAMALEALGVTNPSATLQFEDYLETLRLENEFADRTDPSSWIKVAKLLGVTAKQYTIKGWDLSKTYAQEIMLPELQKGNAIIISVFKPPKGHIVRLQDITEEGLIVDDPFGKVDAIAREKGGFGYKGSSNPSHGKEGGLVGEDNLWKWEIIEKISIKYYLIFSK